MAYGGFPLIVSEAAFGYDPGNSYLKALFTMSNAANQKLYVDLTSAFNGASENYDLNGGEYLEYDVFVVGTVVRAAVDIACTDASELSLTGAVDQNGIDCTFGKDISAYADGAWYHRIIKIPTSWAGKTVDRVRLGCVSINGTFEAHFRDILITDGGGRGYALGWTRGQGLPSQIVDVNVTGNGYTLDLIQEPVQWDDITDYVLGFAPKRGRPGGKMVEADPSVSETGTCPTEVDNTDRAFDATNSASPFNHGGGFGPAGNLIPSAMIRHRALWPLNLLAKDRVDPQPLAASGFETGGTLVAWTDESTGGGTFTASGTGPYEGTYHGLGTASSGQKAQAVSDRYPVRAEREVTVSAAFFKYSGTGNSFSKLAVRCYDKGGTLLGTIVPARAAAGLTLPGASFNPPGVYTLYGGTILPADFPAGTDTFAVVVTPVDLPGAPQSVAVDAVQVTPGSVYPGYLGDGVWHGLFMGRIVDWPVRWETRRSTVEFSCSDEMYVLNRETTPARFYAQALSSTRIRGLLLASGFTGTKKDALTNLVIETGLTTVQAVTLEEADPPLGHIQDAVKAEIGLYYIDGFGRSIFHARSHRYTSPGSISDAVWSDAPGPTEYLYVGGDPEYGSDMIANFIRTRPAGAITWTTGISADSIRRYGTQSLQREPIIVTDAEAQDQSFYLLGRLQQPGFYFSTVRVDPLRDDRLWPKVLAYEPGQRITLERTPRGGGPPFVEDYYIESLEHQVSAPFNGPRSWITNYAISPADAQSYWVLGDAASSILGTTTRLAF